MRSQQIIGQLHELRARGAGFQARAASASEATPELLEESLGELGVVLEELRVTEEELRAQNQLLAVGFDGLHADRRRYEELFRWAPDAHVETDLNGVIQIANEATGELLEADTDLLTGKPLPAYVALEERHAFRTRMQELPHLQGAVRHWTARLRSRSGKVWTVDARARAATPTGQSVPVIWWNLRAREPASGTPVPKSPATASTLGGDADDMLRHVVTAATSLFRAAGAGIMLLGEDGTPRWVTSTDARVQALEDAQATFGQGPCLDAVHQDELVWTGDVTGDRRWPKLNGALGDGGVGGVLCAPLVLDERTVGSFNVFAVTPLDWTDDDRAMVESFAGLVVGLLQVRADARQQQELAAQLQHALDSRVVIEQAKGVLLARRQLTPEQAWTLLRDTARSHQRKVGDLAAEVVQAGDLTIA